MITREEYLKALQARDILSQARSHKPLLTIIDELRGALVEANARVSEALEHEASQNSSHADDLHNVHMRCRSILKRTAPEEAHDE